ncbi:hypothetical protein [Agarivorans sp. DSG3-1]|uniref:hypothetical protein n=1 Tax=Agarivorans sp. DSG3-1 TaxID=3342249 RepID=UPI00398EEA0B
MITAKQSMTLPCRSALGLAALLSISSVHADTWHFRGTPNNWASTAMSKLTPTFTKVAKHFLPLMPVLKLTIMAIGMTATLLMIF